MTTIRLGPTTKPVTFLYYFWLPAGIDEFELDEESNHPFENTAKYRDGFEGAIAKRFKNILLANLKSDLSDRFHFNEEQSPLHVQHGGLGLRKLEFEFRYDPKPRESETYNLTNQLRGHALIFSNGLYLWRFDAKYPSNLTDREITQSAGEFLHGDFIKGPIARLFDFEWDERDQPLHSDNEKNSYNGVLTFYQIDLLFNGIFDKDAHPVNFMKTNLDSGPKEDKDKDDKKVHYKVGTIIESVSWFAVGKHHFSFFGDLDGHITEIESRKKFESHDSTATELFGTAWGTAAERLVSRMTHAGMEQFLKVSIFSSLLHYKAGLDHCRTQLTNDSLLIRINKTAAELRRKSLSPVLSSADLQAYTSLVAGKLPALQFLHSVINELEQATRPTEAQNDTELVEPDWAEWVSGRYALHNALRHYQLYVESINNDITEINRSLETGRIDEVITELTDTRKLTEIASDPIPRVVARHER